MTFDMFNIYQRVNKANSIKFKRLKNVSSLSTVKSNGSSFPISASDIWNLWTLTNRSEGRERWKRMKMNRRGEGGGWDGRGWEREGGCGRFFTWRQKQGEEPIGSAGNSRARPSSRKALSAVIHYSATSTISLCQAIFTRSDKIDSMYKRMCNPPPAPPPTHHHLFIYLAR